MAIYKEKLAPILQTVRGGDDLDFAKNNLEFLRKGKLYYYSKLIKNNF